MGRHSHSNQTSIPQLHLDRCASVVTCRPRLVQVLGAQASREGLAFTGPWDKCGVASAGSRDGCVDLYYFFSFILTFKRSYRNLVKRHPSDPPSSL